MALRYLTSVFPFFMLPALWSLPVFFTSPGSRSVCSIDGRAAKPRCVLWVLALPLGAIAQLDFIWLVADTLNALMALPNLIALLLLSPVVFKLTKEYFAQRDSV